MTDPADFRDSGDLFRRPGPGRTVPSAFPPGPLGTPARATGTAPLFGPATGDRRPATRGGPRRRVGPRTHRSTARASHSLRHRSVPASDSLSGIQCGAFEETFPHEVGRQRDQFAALGPDQPLGGRQPHRPRQVPGAADQPDPAPRFAGGLAVGGGGGEVRQFLAGRRPRDRADGGRRDRQLAPQVPRDRAGGRGRGRPAGRCRPRASGACGRRDRAGPRESPAPRTR